MSEEQNIPGNLEAERLLINDPIVIRQFLGFCSIRWRNWMGRINRNILPVLVLAGN